MASAGGERGHVEGLITEFLKTHPQAKIKAVRLADPIPNEPDQGESQRRAGTRLKKRDSVI